MGLYDKESLGWDIRYSVCLGVLPLRPLELLMLVTSLETSFEVAEVPECCLPGMVKLF